MGDGSTNINVVGAGMGSAGAPTAFQAWSKSCEDTLALQGGFGEDKLWKYFNELK